MTTQDINKINDSLRAINNDVKHDLQAIKKEKLPLSTRIKIEIAIAKLEAISTMLNTKYS